MKLHQVGIVGAGVAGLYTGLLFRLRNPDCKICISERHPASQGPGLGIILHKETFVELLASDPRLGVSILGHACPINHISLRHQNQWVQSKECKLYGISRGALIRELTYRCLEVGVEIRWDECIENINAYAGFDLVVISNGLRSNLRSQFPNEFRSSIQQYKNRLFWMQVDMSLDRLVFDFFDTGQGVAVLHGYPFSNGLANIIIELPVSAALELKWRCSGDTDRVAAELSAMFSTTLNGKCARFGRSNEPLDIDEAMDISCSSWVLSGRETDPPAVLVGDAARSAHFSIGSGTRLAIDDARALVDAVTEANSNLPEALRSYQRQRIAVSQKIQRKARRSGAWFEGVEEYMKLPPSDLYEALMNRCNDSKHVQHTSLQQLKSTSGISTEKKQGCVVYAMLEPFDERAINEVVHHLLSCPDTQLIACYTETESELCKNMIHKVIDKHEIIPSRIHCLLVQRTYFKALIAKVYLKARQLGAQELQWISISNEWNESVPDAMNLNHQMRLAC